MMKITRYMQSVNGQATIRQLSKKFNTSNVKLVALLQDAISAGELSADLPEIFSSATLVSATFPVVAAQAIDAPTLVVDGLPPVVTVPFVETPVIVEELTVAAPTIKEKKKAKPAVRIMDRSRYPEQYATIADAEAA